MSNKLQIKSRAVEVYDFRKVDISQFLTGFSVNEEQYQADLARILNRYGKKVRTTQVELGDLVTINSVSKLPRFNKKVLPVTVGRGLFDHKLECELVGMAVGESKTVTIDIFDTTMTVMKVVHTEPAELTDDNVASFGIEGVSTVADLRRYCVGKQVEAFVLEDENADMAAAFVWQETAKNSRVERDADEIALAHAKAAKKKAELDELPAESDAASIGLDVLEQMFENELDLAAIGQWLMEGAGAVLTEDDYASWIDRMQDTYPGKTRAELEEETGPTEFAIITYADYLAHEIDEYVASVFKDHFTKE